MGFDDFKQLVDNMQINLYLTDIQTNEIIFMNNKMKEFQLDVQFILKMG